MTIDILYFESCPNYEITKALVRSAIDALGVRATIQPILVETPEAATEHGFLGSPTVRIDGVDIEPSARGRTDCGLTCRRYGAGGIPTVKMIIQALREATGEDL